MIDHGMTEEELRELADLEKTCGIQPYSECEGACRDPDAHAAAKKRYLILKEKDRRNERALNAYASST